MKRTFLVLLALTLALNLSAQDKKMPAALNEIRAGWGDMMFETAVWHDSPSNYNYSFTGHIFAEYQRCINNWFGLGFEADWERVGWTNKATGANHFYNLGFWPTARFTYYRKGIVSMYSGIGIGININGGSETDYKGRKTICAPLVNLTAYAISLQWNDHMFATFEIGGINAIKGKQEIYFAGSRLLSVSIGYRF